MRFNIWLLVCCVFGVVLFFFVFLRFIWCVMFLVNFCNILGFVGIFCFDVLYIVEWIFLIMFFWKIVILISCMWVGCWLEKVWIVDNIVFVDDFVDILRIFVLIVGNEMDVICFLLVFWRYVNMEVFMFLVVSGFIGMIWKRYFVFNFLVFVIIMDFGVWGLYMEYLFFMELFFFWRMVVLVFWFIERFKELLVIIVMVFVDFLVILLGWIWKYRVFIFVFMWFDFCLIIGENVIVLGDDVWIVFLNFFCNFLLKVWMVKVFLLYNINFMFFIFVEGFFWLYVNILLK